MTPAYYYPSHYLGDVIWATNTNGKDATRLELFPDGYMALTKSNGETIWLLNRGDNDINGCYLELKGNDLVLYGYSQTTKQYKKIWSRPQWS
jgi:hypothetical protein